MSSRSRLSTCLISTITAISRYMYVAALLHVLVVAFPRTKHKRARSSCRLNRKSIQRTERETYDHVESVPESSHHHSNFEFFPGAITMMARDASTDTVSMERRRRPQHWLLQLVKVVPLCCFLMTRPAAAFITRPFSARQHVSLDLAQHKGRHLLRPQRLYSPRNKRSDLSMSARQMVRACFCSQIGSRAPRRHFLMCL